MTKDSDRENQARILADQAAARTGSRARNRTEMLTPEMTRQMRAEFSRGGDAPVESVILGRGGDDYESPRRSFGSAQVALPPGAGSESEENGVGPQPQTEVRVPANIPHMITPSSRYTHSQSENESEVETVAEGAFAPIRKHSYQPQDDEVEQGIEEVPVSREERMSQENRYQDRGIAAQFTPPSYIGADNGYGREEDSLEPVATSDERITWQKMSPLTGFLVTFDRDPLGEYHELRSGRLIISSEYVAHGNVFFIPSESVSPMHAIMKVADGTVQVLDQLSESGTKIKRASSGEELHLSGDKGMLEHGDTLWFGDRRFRLCLVGSMDD